MSDLNPKDHPVGTRCLIRDHEWSAQYLSEIEIVEWTASGKRVKVRHPSGSESWENLECDRMRVEEVIGITTPRRTKAKKGKPMSITAHKAKGRK